jgi:hypothetical protein
MAENRESPPSKPSIATRTHFSHSKSVACGLLLLLLDGMVLFAPATAAQTQETGWQVVSTSGVFFQRLLSPVVYDPTHARFLFFGGAGGDAIYGLTVAFYPSNNTFVLLNPTVHPSPRYAPALSFDEACGCAVLFGGAYKQNGIETIYNDTWLYFPSNNTWTEVPTGVAPPARHLAAMVYSPSAGTNFLFGGTDNLTYNDLWSFNTSKLAWTLLENYTLTPNLMDRPLNRFAFGMAPADGANSFLVFGGASVNSQVPISQVNRVEEVNDTWAYSYSQQKWSNLTSGIYPSGRTFPAMASATGYGLTVVFGGSAEWDPFTTTNYLSDTWVLDQSTGAWYQLNITSPPPMFGASLGYDPIGRSFLLFGGEGVGAVSSAVWKLNASVVLSLIRSMATTTTTSTVTRTITVPATITGPTSTTTATQTVVSTTTQSSSSVPTWAYATMVVLLIAGLTVGYFIKRPPVNKP